MLVNDLLLLLDLFGNSEETKLLICKAIFVWCLQRHRNGGLNSGLKSAIIVTDALFYMLLQQEDDHGTMHCTTRLGCSCQGPQEIKKNSQMWPKLWRRFSKDRHRVQTLYGSDVHRRSICKCNIRFKFQMYTRNTLWCSFDKTAAINSPINCLINYVTVHLPLKIISDMFWYYLRTIYTPNTL